jgi:capsid portal protein
MMSRIKTEQQDGTLELSEQDKALLEYMEQVQRDIVCMFAIPPAMLGVSSNHTEKEYDNARKRLIEDIMYGESWKCRERAKRAR